MAVTWLPPGPSLRFQAWDAGQKPMVNEGDDWINHWLLLPRAQVKALGIPVESTDTNADAEILWSEFFLDRIFDFDRSDEIEGTDFQGIAIHEVGHALGFASGTESYDQLHAGLLTVAREQINDFSVLPPLDMFRCSTQSPTLIDVTPGNDAYFSIDGRTTRLATFATGESFGDGWQAGHWKAASGQGIMDANLPDDAIRNLTALDLRAMDVIDWDIAATGDFNHEGIVDAADYVAWRNGHGTTYTQYTQAAYNKWRANFGATTAGAAAVARSPHHSPVPEPPSRIRLTLALAGLASCRRKVPHGMWVRRSAKSLGSPAWAINTRHSVSPTTAI